LFNFDILYFSTDGCINKSLTYLLTYLHVDAVAVITAKPSWFFTFYYLSR